MKKVLLVNDSRFENQIIKDILDYAGYEVQISDEYDAIKKIKQFEPEYVILNLMMKNIRGDQLAAMIKLENSQIKCIISSNNAIKIDDFNKKRVDGVFQTPIDRKGIETVLNNINIDTSCGRKSC